MKAHTPNQLVTSPHPDDVKKFGKRDAVRIARMATIIRTCDVGDYAVRAEDVHALIVENRELKRQVKELKR